MHVARHHLKESQSPPYGWDGLRRVRPSRGYWSEPAAALRARAVATVAERRFMAAIEYELAAEVPDGFPAELFEDLRDQRLAGRRSAGVELVRVKERSVIDEETGAVRTWAVERLGSLIRADAKGG